MPVRWRKVWVSDESYEAAGVFDVNNDGVPDIVSGAWWYEGPDYKKKHHICNVAASGEYYDDFSVLPMDVNGDGHMDFVTGGWWGDAIRWRENPGDSNKEWKEHIIANVGNVETTRLWDVDGDGQLEIVPNTPNRELAVYKLKTDSKGRGTGEFTKHLIREEAQGHGLGCGDIAGNGRSDFVISKGWLEAPKNTFKDEWKWHPDFDLGCGSIPIIVTDVNKDGVNDIIVGQAHPFGLDWWEQRIAKDGKRTWIRHPIDPFNAQYHDMHWVDIDGDGECELVTGKRHRAHCGNEPGEFDDYGIYYFKWNGESFSKQVITYGPIGRTKGCGIQFAVRDLHGTGRLDIVAPGKDGLFILENLGM